MADKAIVVRQPTMVKHTELALSTYNPRRISDRMLESLKTSLRQYGVVQSFVVQKKGMVLIAGHQRLTAIKALQAESGNTDAFEVPCVVLDVDDRTAKKLNIALNKISGEFDHDALVKVIESINKKRAMSDDEILALGFRDKEMERFIAPAKPAPIPSGPEDLSTFARSITMSLQFDTVEDRDAVKALLGELVKVSGKKSGYIVKELLTQGEKQRLWPSTRNKISSV